MNEARRKIYQANHTFGSLCLSIDYSHKANAERAGDVVMKEIEAMKNMNGLDLYTEWQQAMEQPRFTSLPRC